MTNILKGIFPTTVQDIRSAYKEATTIANILLEEDYDKAKAAIDAKYNKAKGAIVNKSAAVKGKSDAQLYQDSRHISISDIHFEFVKAFGGKQP